MNGVNDNVLRAGQYLWRRTPAPFRRGLVKLTQRVYTVGVLGLVPNSKNEVLLLRHRFRAPYEWGLPGGFLEPSETPEAAFARELREEVNLQVAVRPGVLMHELNHAASCVTYFVLAEPTLHVPGLLNRQEISDYRFADAESLPANIQPSHRRVLEHYWRCEPTVVDNLVVVP